MRKPHHGSSYVILSDGDPQTLWKSKGPAMASLARRTVTYARMTLDGVTPRMWNSRGQPPAKLAYLLVGTAEAEEIWEGLTQEQAHAVFRWVSREVRKVAAPDFGGARLQPRGFHRA